jgi:hypothetical protein
MRWAEGHSYNVNKWFLTILRSPRLTLLEKAEFIYYGLYYLQSALFILGSAAWLVSEIVLQVRIPEWTAMLGWSLLFSNLFSLPLMNLAGLMLEGSPRRDYQGVLGAVALSFLLVPFQAWASVKGLFERKEGGWFRTPKTGRVTDRVEHLPQKNSLNRWLHPRPSARGEARFRSGRPAGRTFRLICVAAPILVLTILGIGAATAPTVLAANVYYLHNPAGAYTIDNAASGSTPAKFQMSNPGATQTWASIVTYTGQTVPAGSYVFTYWTSGQGGATVTAVLTFGYSASATCAVVVPIASWTASLVNGGGSTTSTDMPAVILPSTSYLCWQITVAAVNVGGLDLRYDGTHQQTSIATPSIVVPEHGSPLIGLAILLPLLAGQLIRRPLRARRRIR